LASETKTVTERKRLVLDANILLRGVFGIRVLTVLETYEDSVSFYMPDICFSDGRFGRPEDGGCWFQTG
jgi:hypothetical protein